MAEIKNLDGSSIDDGVTGANRELVELLRRMLADAEAGRCVVMAGVVGHMNSGKLDLRLIQVTNNWAIHDRILARVGALRTMMEMDLIENMKQLMPVQGGSDDGGGDAA